MVFTGQFAIPLFDILGLVAFFDPEDFIIIFFYGNLHDLPMEIGPEFIKAFIL
jgi:hypothetical protein